MRCIVTAGPTYEPLDEVRRLTNFSTGRFGSMLANHLVEKKHDVLLLLSESVNPEVSHKAQKIVRFSTSKNLAGHLESFAGSQVNTVFHAAAVSDFQVGEITSSTGQKISRGKIPTGEGEIRVQLLPALKIIEKLHSWFGKAFLVGWKYEVEGQREEVLEKCREQIQRCRTHASVANGPAYGLGFGLIKQGDEAALHFRDPTDLFNSLEKAAQAFQQK